MSWPSILTIARAELRRGWRAMVLIGLLAGLVGATTVGSLALARRTTTAHDRLAAQTHADDARGTVLVHDDLVERIVSLPEVTESWTGRIGVAQVEGTYQFLGVTAGPTTASPLLHPIVLDGRLPARAEGDVIEVALREDFQRVFHIALGTEVTVRFLTLADYFRFDTGFAGGQPNGPRLRIRIVGTIRMADDSRTVPPAFAAPEALLDHPDAFEPGASWFVRLAHGQASFDRFRARVDALAAERTLPPEAGEFVVADVTDTTSAGVSVDHTATLLGRALLALAAAVGVAGLVAVIQAFARHHLASASQRSVESALGLTSAERGVARLVTSVVPAAAAGALTAAGVVAAGRLDPIGAIANYEPNPGPAVNLAVGAVGVVVVMVVVIAASVVTSAIHTRRVRHPVPRESRLVARTARLGGSPAGVTGLRFALEPGRGTRAVPVRSAITGAIVGIAGVVAGIVFTASLDRLVTSPSRTGMPFDAYLSDVTDQDVAVAVATPGVGTAVEVSSAPLTVDGADLHGHALTDVRGSLTIDLDAGRLPRTPDEIVLGLRAARDLHVGVGDVVTAVDADGREHPLAVTGTGVVPPFDGEPLGVNALLTPAGLARAAQSEDFRGLVVTARPGTDPEALVDRLDDKVEADGNQLPTEIDNLRQLGRLPSLVAALVGAIAVLALANALVVLVRRRRRDLALLRTVGFTRRQTATAVVWMAVAIVVTGVVVGVPVGVAVGSTLWQLTAEGAFVTTDPLILWWGIVGVTGAALAVGLGAALLPARHAAASAPAQLLRTE